MFNTNINPYTHYSEYDNLQQEKKTKKKKDENQVILTEAPKTI